MACAPRASCWSPSLLPLLALLASACGQPPRGARPSPQPVVQRDADGAPRARVRIRVEADGTVTALGVLEEDSPGLGRACARTVSRTTLEPPRGPDGRPAAVVTGTLTGRVSASDRPGGRASSRADGRRGGERGAVEERPQVVHLQEERSRWAARDVSGDDAQEARVAKHLNPDGGAIIQPRQQPTADPSAPSSSGGTVRSRWTRATLVDNWSTRTPALPPTPSRCAGGGAATRADADSDADASATAP